MHRPALALLLLSPLIGCKGGDCEDSPPTCSADGLVLTACTDGQVVQIACMAEHGQLCDQGACVDPWRYGSPSFPPPLQTDPLATGLNLASKAARYDAIAVRLHLHPELKWVMGVRLKGSAAEPRLPAVPEDRATVADVESWRSGENDGLWSALYLASQAYRYAVTREPAALANVQLLLEGERTRMEVTGVPGVFTRQYLPPGISGLACPTATQAYARDAEKDDNRWVRVEASGCVSTVSPASGLFETSSHCGLERFAGYCWLDNVSKDEYAGHLFGLGAVVKLVDDPSALAIARELLSQIGHHLIEHRLRFTDWDGRVTEHGRLLPFGFDDFPGFNAAMAMEIMRVAAEGSGDAAIARFYEDCMLMRHGAMDCLDSGLVEVEAFPSFLPSAGMYVGPEGCRSNYNNISMHMLSLHHLLWFEHDPALHAEIQRSFDADVVRAAEQPRAIIYQNNALFDFMWAAQKALGPGSDGPAFAAVQNGVRMLRQFRSSQALVSVSLPARYQPYCQNRFDEDVSQIPREAGERCSATFLWWGDPYDLDTCGDDPRTIDPPQGYLLPYWMGRYYGFIGPEL